MCDRKCPPVPGPRPLLTTDTWSSSGAGCVAPRPSLDSELETCEAEHEVALGLHFH